LVIVDLLDLSQTATPCGRHESLSKDRAERVHQGDSYDIVVDTTDTATGEYASLIAPTPQG
jgi:chloramphenicol 3-O-phosphotransferase